MGMERPALPAEITENIQSSSRCRNPCNSSSWQKLQRAPGRRLVIEVNSSTFPKSTLEHWRAERAGGSRFTWYKWSLSYNFPSEATRGASQIRSKWYSTGRAQCLALRAEQMHHFCIWAKLWVCCYVDEQLQVQSPSKLSAGSTPLHSL